MFEIVRYTADKAKEWNQFVAESKNGTFLFDRHYMDYHSDRFEDYSLMFYRDGGLYALLPANREDNILWSHRGLTYGGIIMNAESTAARIQQLFRELNDYLRADGFIKVVYKPVPHIFHRIPSEEDIYSLFSVCDAKLISKIPFRNPLLLKIFCEANKGTHGLVVNEYSLAECMKHYSNRLVENIARDGDVVDKAVKHDLKKGLVKMGQLLWERNSPAYWEKDSVFRNHSETELYT